MRWQAAVRRELWLVPLLIAAYATALGLGAAHEYFNPDEISNTMLARLRSYADLAGSILSVWHNYGRLAGLAYFKTMHGAFGFHVLPFRLGTLLVCAINVLLLNAVLARLVRNRPARYVALLAGTFHGAMWSIYASAGTIFDVLCLTFTLAALLCYRRIVPVAFFTLLAIASKEIGYALPPILLAYELLIVRAQLPGYDRIDFLRALPRLAASFGIALIAGLGTVRNYSVFRDGPYAPQFNAAIVFDNIRAHAESLAFKVVDWPASVWVALLLVLLIAALLLRSRTAVFGWTFYLLATGPMLFSMPRTDGYAVYVAYAGCAIYAGGVLDALLAWRPRAVVAIPAIAAIVMGVQLWQRANVTDRFGPGNAAWVQELATQIREQQPVLPPHSRILLIDDPFGEERFQPEMILQLSYADDSLQVVKAQGDPPPEAVAGFTHVFRYVQGRYVEIAASP